jgi:hypothetical protein
MLNIFEWIGIFGDVDFSNVDMDSGDSRSTADDVLEFVNINLKVDAVNSLLSFLKVPLKIRKGYIRRITAKAVSGSNLLAENIDSSFEIEGLYLVLESTGPIVSAQPTAAPKADPKTQRADRQVHDLFTNPKQVQNLLDLVASLNTIKVSDVNIRIEATANGVTNAVGIVWEANLFSYAPLSAGREKQYEVSKLNNRGHGGKFKTRAVTLSLPNIYFNHKTKVMPVAGTNADFVKAMTAAFPKENGVNNQYQLLDGNAEVQLVLNFKIGPHKQPSCLTKLCMPCFYGLQLCCCCSVPEQSPSVEQVELIGMEVTFSKLEVNMTDEMLPMVRGAGPLEMILFKLGNSGIEITDHYTMEYMVYSTLLTTMVGGNVVARDLPIKLGGKFLIGGKHAWIRTMTPNDGQSVGVFLLNAPNNRPLFPSLVIDLAYRPDDRSFPDDPATGEGSYV